MKIQIGEVCMDKVSMQTVTIRTRDNFEQRVKTTKSKKYLLPCMRVYGDEFVRKLNSVFKVAVGIGDMVLTNRGKGDYQKHLFILLDSKVCNSFFIEFIEWIRDQYMYEDDYAYDNIMKSSFHMVILRFPTQFYEAFETFKLGEYSKMYDMTTIEKYFSQHHPATVKVLIKDHNYRVIFAKQLNREYHLEGNLAIRPDQCLGELDFPPTAQTEVFNNHLRRF